ncbi:MAG: hypothetical protein GX952_03180 [Firmicutes bacterium]|nr:hypothetical protein [Bacillota bacterium]
MNANQTDLVNLVNTLLDTIHQQQLQTDQNNQTTMSQASTAQSDRQRLDRIMNSLVQMKTELTAGDLAAATVQSHQDQLEQIEDQLRQQIRETDNQITQGLQQAVTALAQVQGSMLDGQTYTTIEQMISDLKAATGQFLQP